MDVTLVAPTTRWYEFDSYAKVLVSPSPVHPAATPSFSAPGPKPHDDLLSW